MKDDRLEIKDLAPQIINAAFHALLALHCTFVE